MARRGRSARWLAGRFTRTERTLGRAVAAFGSECAREMPGCGLGELLPSPRVPAAGHEDSRASLMPEQPAALGALYSHP